jgi:hypothetical protein
MSVARWRPLDDGLRGTRTARRNVLIEIVFEMNYTTGQWRKLQLKRTFPFMTWMVLYDYVYKS